MTTEQLKELEKLNERWANEHLETSADFNDLLTAVMDLIPDTLEHIKQLTAERDEAVTVLGAWTSAFGTSQLTHALAKLDAAQKMCDTNFQIAADAQNRLQRSEGACAKMRTQLQRVFNMCCNEDTNWDYLDADSVRHALSTDCGKGYHADSEWEPVVEALEAILPDAEDYPNATVVKIKQALAHAEKLMDGK